MTVLMVILLLLGLAALGVPLIVSVAGSVAVYIALEGEWMLSYPQQVIAGMDGFILLAMPLFILAGVVMNSGGISTRIFEFARALVGPLPGGLAQVNVLTSVFFGGMVGTSVADLAGTGSVVIPQMKRNGYPASFSAAVTASSSGIGPLLPPSSPMILYSAVTGTSLGALFLAGIIPGVLLAVVLMILVAVQSKRHGWGSVQHFRLREVLRTLRGSILAFGTPLIIVGGLTLGVFTPTESGAFAVIYAVVVAMFVYRSLSLRRLYRALVSSAVLTGEVMLIVGVSVALGAALSRAGVPQALSRLITSMAPDGSQIVVLLMLAAICLIAGMLLDPLIPVIMPVLLPTLLIAEIDLIQFGVIAVLTVVIGQVTPPVAMSLVVAGKIGKVDAWDVFRANTPFLVATLGLLALVIMLPGLSTWLPSLLGS
ncbi:MULTISPECIES: TRAP transporter large permease [Actinoalloteichus]|uniref:TRAP transporter, DctM subunit n=1 Tax=Actinoalloteichus fjordicus TaxID=1612552 RepID=A0AAC9PT02_9PSEU|nr:MULTISPECIES: TRAP transporter large permease [Actinoalloteichus]APU16129.1 TRAP transporter, DctM subunit [Actinoalloteichus fjordicus]APU22192.1 TRAP transporter, DctM subunit [Actinoalloteichus sp. GBA129-24]